MDITNTIRKYVECASSGAITEPTGGSWISALAIWQGSTEPLHGSWLIRVCDNFGITQPEDGSWLIALSFYYERFTPTNGSWSYSIQLGCEAGPPAPSILIWDQTTSEWQDEEAAWAIAAVPTTPTFTQDGTLIANPTPTLTGTADALIRVDLNVDGTEYTTNADATGAWSITTNSLSGVADPGTEYTITVRSKNIVNGLISAEFQGNIFIEATSVDCQVIMNTGWSLGWIRTWVEIQERISVGPEVWQSIEYEGNPTFLDSNNNPQFYKTTAGQYGAQPGIYGMNFYNTDTGGTIVNVARDIKLEPGVQYRIIGRFSGGSPNYGQYTSYSLFQAGSQLLSQYFSTANDYDATGVEQQTFQLN